jgi:XTP/dITP diphosphohydrolase
MKNIILASNNAHKLEEIQNVLSPVKINTLSEIGFTDEIEETANTFEGNALIKCETIYQIFKKPVISDDSGLLVHYLNDAPGVYSSRYAGQNVTDQMNYEKLLENLKDVADRRAKFVTTICYYQSPQNIEYFKGELAGSIAEHPEGYNGFGYDPIFIPEGFNQTLGQLSSEIKNRLSHRARALEKFNLVF